MGVLDIKIVTFGDRFNDLSASLANDTIKNGHLLCTFLMFMGLN
jgi:hypothetical protein